MENSGIKKITPYKVISLIILIVLAIFFIFPLYWIVTGAFKTNASINATTPDWFPKQWVLTNFQKLFAKRSVDHLFGFFGPKAPAAFRWLFNTVFIAVMAMILTCITATMAGYALAKKRFTGKKLLFTLIVCAMALPKQVILIPLIREMSALHLYDNI